MERKRTNIHDATWEDATNPRGDNWRFLDLSGDHLGVRIEKLPPGGTSSYHHFHTQEEEHVLILEGSATLFLGAEQHAVGEGDHFCFLAGQEEGHHFENTGTKALKFLVFGERKSGDVVVYPEHGTMYLKALGGKLVNYAERESEDG